MQQGIINPEDLENLFQTTISVNTNITFIDASYALPNTDENTFENFKCERIPNAVFFDIDAVSDTQSPLPHMLPNVHIFNSALSDLGILKQDLLIIYGQRGMIMGPARVWWMMKVFGHNNVLVLNGGLPAWKAAGLKTETKMPHIPKKSTYIADQLNIELVADFQQVISASKEKLFPIIDARPAARYNGTIPEPREGMRSGHIPNSKNLPSSTLIDEKGFLKPKETLKQLFEDIGIKLNNQKIILSCGSGITACALGLALFTLGHTDFSVYDGSWSEWGSENSALPVSTNIEKP